MQSYVVRCYENENVTHVEYLSTQKDIEIIETELILKDIETVSKVRKN